jgi:hypothetical protein
MSVDGCSGVPDAVAVHAAADLVHGPFRADEFRSASPTDPSDPTAFRC